MKNNSAHVATAFRGNLTDKNRSDLKKQEDAHSLNIHCTERWLYNITLWLEALYVSCFVTNMAGISDGSKIACREIKSSLFLNFFFFQGIIKFFPLCFNSWRLFLEAYQFAPRLLQNTRIKRELQFITRGWLRAFLRLL